MKLKELKEFRKLSAKLFGDDKFVVPGKKNKKKWKRYNELMIKYQKMIHDFCCS